MRLDHHPPDAFETFETRFVAKTKHPNERKASSRSFEPMKQRFVSRKVPDVAKIKVGRIALKNVLEPLPAFGGKFELNGDGRFAVKFEEAVGDMAEDGSTDSECEAIRPLAVPWQNRGH